MFASLVGPSHHGDCLNCGDMIERVIYPGILIKSLDGEEACASCGTRAANANHPCPGCLVHHDDLHRLSMVFVPRSTETMKAVVRASRAATTKAEAERLLQVHGLHDVEVCVFTYPSTLRSVCNRTSSGLCDFRTHISHSHTIPSTSMTAENLDTISGI